MGFVSNKHTNLHVNFLILPQRQLDNVYKIMINLSLQYFVLSFHKCSALI